MIWTLLQHGAEIDAIQESGRAAIHAAAYFGNLYATRTFVHNGAALHIMDHDGYTAVRCSLYWEHPEVALTLLQTRVRVNTQYAPHGNTALHLAVGREDLKVAEQFISKGTDLHP